MATYDPSNPPKVVNLRQMIRDPNTVMLVAIAGPQPKGRAAWVTLKGADIVGSLTLIINRTLTQTVGFIPHVVVDPARQNEGIGTMLVREALRESRGRGVTRVELTSGRDKPAANHVYAKLGFQLHETNNWRYIL